MATTEKKPKPDWQAIKVEFVNGAEYGELAEKHGIKEGTIRARASRGKWIEKRNATQHEVTESAIDRQSKLRQKELAKIDEKALKLSNALFAIAAKGLTKIQQDKPVGFRAQDVKALAGAIAEGHKMGRLALGATTENTGLSDPEGGKLFPQKIELVAPDVSGGH